MRAGIQQFFPGYLIRTDTLLLAGAVIAGLGLLAGLVPAWNASRTLRRSAAPGGMSMLVPLV